MYSPVPSTAEENPLASPSFPLPLLSGEPSCYEGGTDCSSTARIQRAPSERARCASTEDSPSALLKSYSPVRCRYRSACFGSTLRIRLSRLSLSGDPVSGRFGPPPSSEGLGAFGIGLPGPSRRSGIEMCFMIETPSPCSICSRHLL